MRHASLMRGGGSRIHDPVALLPMEMVGDGGSFVKVGGPAQQTTRCFIVDRHSSADRCRPYADR